MSLNIVYTRITPEHPNGFFIQWVLTGVDPRLSGQYRFEVFRSGAPRGPWESISGPLYDTYSFRDPLAQPTGTIYKNVRRPSVFSLTRAFYYKTTVTSPSGEMAETVDDTEPFLDPKQAQYWRKADFDLRRSLKITGTPAAVLKRKRWGERCPKCFDKLLKETTRSACSTCFGTGFTGGYYNPVFLNLRRTVPQTNSSVVPEGRQDGNSVQIYLPYTPQVDPQDLVVFLRDNRRFEVEKQIETQITLVTVHQTAGALELPRDNIAYRIRLDNA